jgi:hypothetical protein
MACEVEVTVGAAVTGAGVEPATALDVIGAATSTGDVAVSVLRMVVTCKAEGGSKKPSIALTQSVQPGSIVKTSCDAESVGEQGLYDAVYSVQESAVKVTDDPVVSG